MATNKKSSGLMFSLRPFISDSHKSIPHVKDLEFKADSVSSVYNTIVWYGKEKELTPELAKQIEENFPGSLEDDNGGSLRDAYDGKMDLKMQKLAKSLVAQFPYSDKKSDLKDYNKDTKVVDSAELNEGFSLYELERFVYANESDIHINLRSCGLSVDDLNDDITYITLADVLGVDSYILRGSDVNFIASFVYDLLVDDSVEDSKKSDDGMVPGDINTDKLLPGFTDGDLLSYVSLNQGFILNNLKGWGLTVEDLGSESDAYVLSDILGCDVSTLDGVDIQSTSRLIQDFLLNDSVVLDDSTTTGDIGAFVPAAFGEKVTVGTHNPVSDAGLVGELKEGFSLRTLEKYVYANEAFIRKELKNQHLDVEDILNIEDYYELSDLLGCSSFVLRDVDLQAITNFIYGLLDDSVADSKKEEVNLVDLLWTLRSAGVVYESRKAMGVPVSEYRAYVEDLIEKNGLSGLTGTDVIKDSVNIFIVTPELVQDLEDLTGFSIQEYTDKDITVSNQEDSYGDSCTVISTVGKTFDSVAKSILSMHIRDYRNSEDDPDQPFKALVLNDVRVAKRGHWSEEDVNSYLDNVLSRKQAPFFITNFSESTDLDESILEESDGMQLFLNTNLDGIENFMGYADEDPIDTVLKAYDLLFREFFSEY